jgi:hypothetical protein
MLTLLAEPRQNLTPELFFDGIAPLGSFPLESSVGRVAVP